MVRLKVQEDNIKLKMNAPDGATFRTNEYTPIMSGTGDYNELDNKPSINGHTLEGDQSSEDLDLFSGDYNDLTNKPDLFSGDYDDLTDKPSINGNTLEGNMTAEELGIHIPTKLSELTNDDGFLKVTDLGEIDGDLYDWEIEEYLNTLQETGSYIFHWDEFKYWVDIEALEVDGTTTVQQIYWDTEEGGIVIYYRNIVVESGEILRADTTNFLTFEEANSAFARNTHTHVRFAIQSESIWDYCNTVALSNTNPFVIYFDLSTNKTYVIETFVGVRQPLYQMQKVTEMNDPSYFCQRSTYYYSGAEHWGDWYKFSGEVFDPSGR